MRRMHWRTVVGLVVALPVAAILLGIFACLPVPVGDPEKSKVDDKLVGGWIKRSDDAPDSLYVVRAFDARTYLVQTFEFDDKDGKIEPKGTGDYKAWLTELGGVRFMTLQPLPIEEPMGYMEKDAKRVWVVMKLETKGADLNIQMVKPDADLLKDVKTREEAEKVLTANAKNADIYGEPVLMRKVTDKDKELVKKVQEAFKEEVGK